MRVLRFSFKKKNSLFSLILPHLFFFLQKQPPSARQGHGRLHLGRSLPLYSSNSASTASSWGLVFADNVTVSEGGVVRFCLENAGSLSATSSSFPLSQPPPPSPLVVTLAWTDRPASPAAASALVNDLDLEVTLPGGGATLLGNGGTLRDSTNNVERVFAPDAFFGASPASTLGGSILIVVRGRSLPLGGSQPFALTVYGAAAAARIRSGASPRLVPASAAGECASAPRLPPVITRRPPLLGNVSTVIFAFETPSLSSNASSTSLPSAKNATAGDASSSPFECKLALAKTGSTSPPPLFAWTRCSSPIELRSLSDGGFTFSVRNYAAGGSSSGSGSVTSASFAVDTVAPAAEIVAKEAPMSSARRGAVFAFRAAAGEASAVIFECRLERASSAGAGGGTTTTAMNETIPTTTPVILLGASSLGTWEACSSPKGYGGLGAGIWVFSVRVRDAAGNEQRFNTANATSASASWSVWLPRHAKLVAAAAARAEEVAPAPSPSPSFPPPSSSANAKARYSAMFSFEADPGDEAAVAAAAAGGTLPPSPTSSSSRRSLSISNSSASTSTSTSSSTDDAFECSLSAWNSSSASYSTIVSPLQPCSSPKTYSDLPGGGTLYLFQVGVASAAASSSSEENGDLAAATQLALGDPPAPADAAALLPLAKIDAFPPRIVSTAAEETKTTFFDVPFSLAAGSPPADRFSCSLQGPADDGSLWSPCSRPYRLDFAAMVDGSYVLRVAAESDAAALAQQAAAEAAAGGGTTATGTFGGRGAAASASFVLDSLAPNVTSIALTAQTTTKKGEKVINWTLLEPVDLTFGAANEVSFEKKLLSCFFPGASRFLTGKKLNKISTKSGRPRPAALPGRDALRLRVQRRQPFNLALRSQSYGGRRRRAGVRGERSEVQARAVGREHRTGAAGADSSKAIIFCCERARRRCCCFRLFLLRIEDL